MGWELGSLSEGRIFPQKRARVEHAELIYVTLERKNTTIIIYIRKYIP